MKTLYLDCSMGAAGDMLMSALYELIDDKDDFLKEVNGLGIPGLLVTAKKSIKCGIVGTNISVRINDEEEKSIDVERQSTHKPDSIYSHGHEHCIEHDHQHDHQHQHEHSHQHEHDHQDEHQSHHKDDHHHNSMDHIQKLVEALPLSDKVRSNVLSVYRLVAEAESIVHGKPIEQIHFHEVGTIDAITDIVGVCLLIDRLAPEKIITSPINVGSGFVRCSHGVLPVPAPATANILQGVPIYSSTIKAELCTPTGAALLKHFTSDFSEMPVISVEKIGYGMGTKDFEVANCLRAFLGETKDIGQQVSELYCNLDDMTPEAIGYAMETLFESGALDVYTIPIGMKKSRPGIMLCCLCQEGDTDRMAKLILRHTTTIGVRISKMKRYTLNRRVETIDTPYGLLRKKISSGFGLDKSKLEYDDIVRIARENDLTFTEVIQLLRDK